MMGPICFKVLIRQKKIGIRIAFPLKNANQSKKTILMFFSNDQSINPAKWLVMKPRKES